MKYRKNVDEVINGLILDFCEKHCYYAPVIVVVESEKNGLMYQIYDPEQGETGKIRYKALCDWYQGGEYVVYKIFYIYDMVEECYPEYAAIGRGNYEFFK